MKRQIGQINEQTVFKQMKRFGIATDALKMKELFHKCNVILIRNK